MIKTKEEIYKLLADYVSPILNIKYNPNLQAESLERLKTPRPFQYVHAGAGPLSDPVMTETSDRTIFGVYLNEDGKTIEYDEHSRILFVIHEICHLLCKRTAYNHEAHCPDLYGWTIGMPNQERIYYHSVQEEMCAGFLGFYIQGKLDIVWDVLYYDSCDKENSTSLNFPNKFINVTHHFDELPEELIDICVFEDGKDEDEIHIYMACDADLSPVFRLLHIDYEEMSDMAQTFKPFYYFGLYFHYLLGIMDLDGNVIGTINKDVIRSNREKIQLLWKIHPNELETFIEFLCA
jgi:hypothetical protein